MSSWDLHWVAENKGLRIVEGSAPSETEKEIAHRLGAGDVVTLATLGSFPHRLEKQDSVGKPGPTGTFSGSCLGRVALRRRVNTMEKPTYGKEGETDQRRHKRNA
jgi:hypothetical protein